MNAAPLILTTILSGCTVVGDGSPRERALPGSADPGGLALEQADPFDLCLRELLNEEPAVRRNLQSTFRLSPDDAHDMVRDAVIAVCMIHPIRRYQRLGAALQQAAINRAIDRSRRNRRYRQCPVDESIPSCQADPDASVRFERERRAVDAALCREDRVSERIILMHLQEGLSFPAIGKELGLRADDARARYHNALSRVRHRLQVCRS